MDNGNVWKIIDSYFNDNPQNLVRHHIESYNDFFQNGIFQIFKEKNPIHISTRFDPKINEFRSQCMMYFGGKDGSKIYFGKPVIYDDNNSHYMYPNEARLRNMTYGMTIHYDVEVEFIDILEEGEQPHIIGLDDVEKVIGGGEDHDEEEEEGKQQGGAPKKQTRKRKLKIDKDLTPNETAMIREATEKSMIGKNRQIRRTVLEKVFLGKFPIMLQSNYCILNKLPRDVRHTMGECKNDVGGYFIIDGKEKTVIAQEKFADNMLYVHNVNSDEYLTSAEIRSVSENVSKPIRTLSVKLVTPTGKYTFKNIVVNVPNVRKPLPLFIVFRALGVISDKDIITMCLLDMKKYENMIDLFIPSVHDGACMMTQRNALNYIAILTKGKTVAHALEILSDYFLPHIGEVNFLNKAYYLGYMVFRLLSVHTGLEQSVDRDNFKFKRIETVGSLIHDLFREYYTIQQREIHLAFEEKINYNESLYANNLHVLVEQYYSDIFKQRTVDMGFRKAFKGNWGSQTHTKRVGVVQDLNRLSFNSMISHLRKTNLPLDASVKLVGPRVLNGSQWGFLDPIDTPDGGNIGLHKHMSISAYISKGVSREPLLKWLREIVDMKLLEDCSPEILSNMTRVIVNGLWAGSVKEPIVAVEKIKLFRRNALLPIYTSVTFDVRQKTIFIYTDDGRLCRPIFYRDPDSGKMSFDGKVMKKIESGDFSWNDLITGFNEKKVQNFNPNDYKMYELEELYENVNSEKNPAKLERFLQDKAIIDYVDCSESEDALIAMNKEELEKDKIGRYTHLEIHESFIFGIMCNMINFPENNPATRNSFSCGQSKQAVSLYSTNYQVRMDKTAVVLSSGQAPLVKSRYMEYVNNEENPYGENAIVAIMCYSGYNVEDAMLLNEGSLKRGLFRTTYFSTYESHEEKTKGGDVVVDKIFTNIESESNVTGTKPGYDYSKLDKHGLIREGTPVDDKTILIGLTATASNMKDIKIDMSKTPKKGQLGIVDKSFITEGEEGKRIAKIRIREERIPSIGDKMASRAGQKGTIGLVVREEDMPFTKDGIRPDIIINPHALPSRMTIGQLVECIIGKASAHYGAFSDCTAFNNKGSKIGVFGELLPQIGFHSSGNEILYNGMTGEQLESEIFMGPNYYMRLKHMVKDKINYRALGPRTALTRQPVSGRANDGGLRIGEMERDSVISHGAACFLSESMMERGDKYFMAVCNTTGMLAIYNPSKDIFMSPMADGPVKYTGSLDGKEINIERFTKYGRSFSVISVPYSLKLLVQELQTMNVQMRLITEENIQQLENMTFSKNIGKLMFNEKIQPNEVVAETKLLLKHNKGYAPKGYAIEENPVQEGIAEEVVPIESPEYIPTYEDESPMYNQYSESPVYNQESPTYHPESVSPETNENLPEHYRPGTYQYNEEIGKSVRITGGEKVHYRGDKKTNRLWTVKNIGDKFITIVTDDYDNLTPEDVIKVVDRQDLYKPGDFSYPIVQQMGNPMGHQGPTPMVPQGPMNGMIPNGINFAPVIKINNGGYEYSNDTEQNGQQPSEMPNLIENVKSNDRIKMEEPQTGGIVVKKDGGSSQAPDNSSGGGIFTNLANAASFVIKKIG